MNVLRRLSLALFLGDDEEVGNARWIGPTDEVVGGTELFVVKNGQDSLVESLPFRKLGRGDDDGDARERHLVGFRQ